MCLFGHIIQNIYSHTFIQIKIGNGLTGAIRDNTGVKQGCVLSPPLFKIFMNDMPKIFTAGCDPAALYNKKVNCLMSADDVVLIAESKDGLQICLDEIRKYSDDAKN